MEYEPVKFWRYLLEQDKKYVEKEEIYEIYEKFIKIWNKEDNFKIIFDKLRRNNKILRLISKLWIILSEEEFLRIRENKSRYSYTFFINLFKYFNQEGIVAYYGLGSAEYFKGNFWQTPHTFYIINDKYNLERKIGNQTVVLIKFPKDTFVKSAILKDNPLSGRPFSDNEKTFLDKIYYIEYKNGKINNFILDNLNFEKINMYLWIYRRYPLVKAHLIDLLDDNQLKELR